MVQNQQLPIGQHREEIIKAVRENPVVICIGDTGSGKSTQIPQFLYHAGYERIGITQPR